MKKLMGLCRVPARGSSAEAEPAAAAAAEGGESALPTEHSSRLADTPDINVAREDHDPAGMGYGETAPTTTTKTTTTTAT